MGAAGYRGPRRGGAAATQMEDARQIVAALRAELRYSLRLERTIADLPETERRLLGKVIVTAREERRALYRELEEAE